jgi:hypothetical protein
VITLRRPKPDPVSDPVRLHVAHHELGHYTAWEALGIGTTEIRIWGYGDNTEGLVTPATPGRLRNQQECHNFLIGLLAGREADLRYCRRAGIRFREARSKADLRAFRRIHKHEWARGTDAGEFRTLARDLVHEHWGDIVRLAPKLAERGRL